jgi:lipopolysaccharide transport system ATP-binding protein
MWSEMNDTAIRVQGLGKQYHIGRAMPAGHDTLRDALASWVSTRWTRWDRRADERTIWALRDVNLEVKRGEVVGIIGRNGAGKSTLLKILARITEPTAGSVDLFGRVGSLLEVGTGFHPELSGRENIFLNGAILGMQRVEITRKFDEIVEFAEVRQFIDMPVKHYSSGMYLRLAFAVAAHLEPEILLVDEVLAVGDAAFQKKCLGKIGEVANAGRTVLFVSHNMAAVTSLCSRAIYLDGGCYVADGNANEIVQLYLARSADHGGIDLAAGADRQGSGLARASTLAITDQNGAALDNIVSGQDVVIRVDYEIPSRISIESGVCILVFKTQLGQPLFTCSTRLFNQYVRLVPHGTLMCHIPHFPLNQGGYYVDLMLKQGNDSRDVLDHVEEAMKFQVIVGDFFGTGRATNAETSPVLVRHFWTGQDG